MSQTLLSYDQLMDEWRGRTAWLGRSRSRRYLANMRNEKALCGDRGDCVNTAVAKSACRRVGAL